jgi:hypothetical protein
MTALLLIHLLACNTPRDTGPTSMVGTIRDPSGAPLAGVQVETLEARWTTDADGRFAVNYKEPSQWLEFQHDGVRYRRFYRPEDDGKVVDVVLPAVAPTRLACEMDASCTGTLTWTLTDGLTAQVSAPCDRDDAQTVPAAPSGAPDQATCRTAPAAPDEPAKVRVRDDGLIMSPPLVPVRVELVTQSDPLPSACEVRVDGQPASRIEDGTYRGDVFGYTVVTATCDGIPATPKAFYTRQEFSFQLLWTPVVPKVEILEPKVTELVLAQIAGTNGGWQLVLPASPDGSFLLPPLGPGTYAFGANMDPKRLAHIKPVADLRPGVLHWRPIDREAWAGDRPEALGVLVLEGELLEGTLPVQVYTSNPASASR